MHTSETARLGNGANAKDEVRTRCEAAQASHRVWAWTLGLALVAGLGAWLVGEKLMDHHVAPTHRVVAMGIPFDAVSPQDRAATDLKNATLVFGAFGASLGLALGIAGGMARRSPRMALMAGLLGLTLGLAGGVGSSQVLLDHYYRQQESSDEGFSRDLVFPILIYGGICASIAAAAGIAFGVGAGARRLRFVEVLLACIIGGVLGAVAYEVIGALTFPNAHTNRPIAIVWPPRLLASLLVPILTAVAGSIALLSPVRKPSKVRLEGIADGGIASELTSS